MGPEILARQYRIQGVALDGNLIRVRAGREAYDLNTIRATAFMFLPAEIEFSVTDRPEYRERFALGKRFHLGLMEVDYVGDH